MVTRESPWDDESRGRALRLAEYESALCGCGCGQPVANAYSDKQAYRVDSFTCQAGRALAQVRRMKTEEAKQAKRPEGWDDGVHYYVTPVEADNAGS